LILTLSSAFNLSDKKVRRKPMRLHVSGKEKDILLDVVNTEGLTASRAIAHIIKQWSLSEARKKVDNGNTIQRG